MLTRGRRELPVDRVRPDEAIKDPSVLEFLDLKDEYSESDLEEALIGHLETFLLELGGDFCFMGRERRLRVGDQWYREDLLFFHRRLRCLVVIDLKIGSFTHADAGQMHFYLNYAREHWVREGENPPVGLTLCSEKDEALAQCALEGLSNKVLAAEYRINLPRRLGKILKTGVRSPYRNRVVARAPTRSDQVTVFVAIHRASPWSGFQPGWTFPSPATAGVIGRGRKHAGAVPSLAHDRKTTGITQGLCDVPS